MTSMIGLGKQPSMESPDSRAWLRLALLVFLMVPLPAFPQTTLTGAMLFSTTSTGAWNNYSELNTVGGDNWWDLWLALNPDATSPVNGPSDAEAGSLFHCR